MMDDDKTSEKESSHAMDNIDDEGTDNSGKDVSDGVTGH